MKSHFVVHATGTIDDRPVVWIIDIGTAENRSVTNDAERVCKELQHEYPDHRIIYRDSEKNWDELVHTHGVFETYRPARDLAPEPKPPIFGRNVSFPRPTYGDIFDR